VTLNTARRYTVEHTVDGPSRLVVIGRLTSGLDCGKRFAAVNSDSDIMGFMLAADRLLTGCTGSVTTERFTVGRRVHDLATFTPHDPERTLAKI
jgi:hypothetical protein